MTIGANWPKVSNWIELIFSVSESQRIQVMYVNESLANASVGRLKVKAAHFADCAIVVNAGRSGRSVALVSIHSNRLSCSFNVLVSWFEFIWKKAFARCTNNCDCLSIFSEAFCGNRPFFVGEQITKRWLEDNCLKCQIRSLCFQESIETSALACTARFQHALRGRKATIPTNSLNVATTPIADFIS